MVLGRRFLDSSPLAPPRSTVVIVRVTFWGGWEEGLWGSPGAVGKGLVKFCPARAALGCSATASLQATDLANAKISPGQGY